MRSTSNFLALLVAVTLTFGLTVSHLPVANAQDPAPEGEAALSEGEIADLLDQANSEARKRRYRKAIPLYKKVLQATPSGNANVYYNLAEIKKFLDDCSEARILYRRYLEISPKSPDAKAVKKAIKACKLSRSGKLKVSVDGPDNLVIILGGIPISTKPNVEVEVRPGKYDLIVRADEYKTFRSKVEVLSRDDRSVDVKLQKRTFFGKLTINVDKKGATVSVDGESIGVSPVETQKIEAGKHRVDIKLAGHYDWVRNVVVSGGEDYQLDVKLSKLDK